MTVDINAMLNGYLFCALWCSTDDEGEPLSDNYFETDISEESYFAARVDLACFLSDCTGRGIDVGSYYPKNSAGIGHDLWLTRNHHGAGFWDREAIPRPIGNRLTSIAQAMGEIDAEVGDDGIIRLR